MVMPRAEHKNILSCCSQQQLGEQTAPQKSAMKEKLQQMVTGEFFSVVTATLSFCGSHLENRELLFCMDFSSSWAPSSQPVSKPPRLAFFSSFPNIMSP